MSKVWRRLQRVGKKATKYHFTTSSHILKINCTSKWQPDRVCITWSRRERKISSKLAQWEPGQINVYEGLVYWERSTDYLEFDVSLYRGINDEKFEPKEWILTIESEEQKGKRRLLASAVVNLDQYASIDPLFQTDICDLNLKPISTKIKSATISFSLSCQFIKDGKATDEDMISIASFMSTASLSNNPYLNSNVMFQRPASTAKMSQFEQLENQDLEIYDHSLDDLDSELIISNFDSINNNFGDKTIVNEVNKDDFKENFLKAFETNKPIKEQASVLRAQPSVIVEELDDCNNPFLNESTNPFIEELDENNPFLDNTLQLESTAKQNSLETNTSKDLLDWCSHIIKKTNYKTFHSLKINDFSKSWMNGLALCAIIHSFKPNLIDLKQLNENDAKKNLKQVFQASDKEKIVRVLDFTDFIKRESLDQLSIMTYLFQLRDHFDPEKTKLMSPTKTNNPILNLSPINKLAPNKQFMNPFDSDEEDVNNNLLKTKSGLIKIKPNGEIVTDDELDEPELVIKRRQRKQSLNNSETTIITVKNTDELVQKAKDLIEKTKLNENPRRDELNLKVKQIIAENKSRKKSNSTPLIQRELSAEDNDLIGAEYVNQEIINLKNEQKELDEQGDNLEQQLRILMKNSKSSKDKDKQLEDHLLKEWFLLVNRKNSLLHKQQELEILQNEKDLEKRYEILSCKLRNLMQIEDFYKTDEQKKLESILLNELISNVVKRNELVQQLDEENKLLTEGEIINDYIQNKASFQPSQDKSCLIQ